MLVWPSLNFSHDRVHSSLVCLEFGPSLTHVDDITSGPVIKLITVAHNIYYEGSPENNLRFEIKTKNLLYSF